MPDDDTGKAVPKRTWRQIAKELGEATDIGRISELIVELEVALEELQRNATPPDHAA
jgi:hypothetical protein